MILRQRLEFRKPVFWLPFRFELLLVEMPQQKSLRAQFLSCLALGVLSVSIPSFASADTDLDIRDDASTESYCRELSFGMEETTYCLVTFVELIVNPARWDGVLVGIVGYLATSPLVSGSELGFRKISIESPGIPGEILFLDIEQEDLPVKLHEFGVKARVYGRFRYVPQTIGIGRITSIRLVEAY